MIGLTKGKLSLCHVTSPFLIIQAKLRDCNFEEGYDFVKNFFIRCFYVNYEGDLENIEKGFLRSSLLVQVCI